MRGFLALILALSATRTAVYARQNDALLQAISALRSGDLRLAESKLEAQLRAHPDDAEALGVLGVVLDQEEKYAEADGVYRRAIALQPRSAGLLNNFGNHLLATGKSEEARRIFMRVVAIAPEHVNANVQLAHIAMEHKAPNEALKYLQALPASVVANDPRLNLAMGVALAGTGKYDSAEQFLSRAAEARPDDFEALYDLGLAAAHGGHAKRAHEVLEKALTLQPRNVAAMYDLAAVDVQLNRKEAALELLARAARIAPDRPEVLALLAHTAADLGYFTDAAKTWEQFLKLRPRDEVARREHAFAETATGENMQGGVADLEAYVRKHQADAVGHYELAMAEIVSDRQQAAKELDRALTLKPDLVPAHVTRGLLSYREGKPETALSDFEFAAKREPDNAGILDRLGEVFVSLGRTQDAVLILKKAADLAPRDTTILLRYARALSKTGHTEEAAAVFARCRELGPLKSVQTHTAGLIDFLGLSPEEQRARYRAGVERTVERDPSNVEAQVRYLELVLEDGKTGEAATVARRIASLDPSPALAADATRALLAAEQYAALKEFIARVPDLRSDELLIDSALADAHLADPEAALQEMDRIPDAERNGDYYLALSMIYGRAGRKSEAYATLNRAFEARPARLDLCRLAITFLTAEHRLDLASKLLDSAPLSILEKDELSLRYELHRLPPK
jgi:tetratricopeptide (TPR) repeat protein